MPTQRLMSDTVLDAVLDYAHTLPEAQRFSFLARIVNRMSFMKVISDRDVANACASIAGRLRSLNQTQTKEHT
jgi:hypothetical protein